MGNIDEKEQAKRTFQEYLLRNSLRSTPERFVIVDTILSASEPFPLGRLVDMVTEQGHISVSRGTIYNNIRLMIEAGIARKLLVNGETRYEKCFGKRHSVRLVCVVCGDVREIADDKITDVITNTRLKRFVMSGYSLTIDGMCSKCSAAMKRKMKRKIKKN